jgi:hypothetical protein
MGSYNALKGHSAAGQRRSPWSSPLKSDGSQDDQAGEAGLVERSSAEAKSLKTSVKSTIRLLLQVEAARRGASGPS